MLKAYLAACDALSAAEAERGLIEAVRDVLAHLRPNPVVDSKHGPVFVSVPGERPGVVYNLPNGTMTVFPGEEHGLGSPPDEFAICLNSYRRQCNEGGNELVLLNLQAARLGVLDLEKFKRQIAYCLLPNGTCADMVLQTLGRYDDARTPFDFMAPMGIWFENFALPAVINECLLQSYDGMLRFFPNWPSTGRAEFRTLRAAGAFLVSAKREEGRTNWVEVLSERGGPLRIAMPDEWREGARVQIGDGEHICSGPMIELDTRSGQIVWLMPN